MPHFRNFHGTIWDAEDSFDFASGGSTGTQDSGHKDWINIESLSQGLTRPGATGDHDHKDWINLVSVSQAARDDDTGTEGVDWFVF